MSKFRVGDLVCVGHHLYRVLAIGQREVGRTRFREWSYHCQPVFLGIDQYVPEGLLRYPTEAERVELMMRLYSRSS